MSFPAMHRTKLQSTDPFELLNRELKHRAGVATLPNEAAIWRLVGVVLPEQNDEWSVQRSRYTPGKPMSELRAHPMRPSVAN